MTSNKSIRTREPPVMVEMKIEDFTYLFDNNSKIDEKLLDLTVEEFIKVQTERQVQKITTISARKNRKI